MKVSYNWLKNLVDLHDIDCNQLADKMTSAGLEIEGLERVASGDKLAIGKVLTCIPHPDSDHMHVCTVDVGTEVLQIVCGAPNVASGQKVIVALEGCNLPGGTINARNVRGVESHGMICSLSELGVDKKQLTEKQLAGIEELGDDAQIGDREVLKYLNLDDVILEVSLTPNRADCLSMWALAKEVGAICDRKVNLPDYSYTINAEEPTLTVDSKTDKCPLFLGKVINKVTIKESPKWIKDILQSSGVKSINNVVDISNLVMLETGQPLHFYDLSKIPGREITVKDGIKEKYTALDGIDYQLEENDILITNNGNVIGIAGIMGGDDSKIDENTTGIIIEAATFNHVSIRDTSRRLNLQTEAATRFTKMIEPMAGLKAVERSTQLLLEYADASGVEEMVTYGKLNDEERKISFTKDIINHILGTQFSLEEILSPLRKLDLKPETKGEEITVTVPDYRMNDLAIREDIAEEVIRINGFDNIVSTLPLLPQTVGTLEDNGKLGRIVKDTLVGYGLYQAMTYSLVGEKELKYAVMPFGKPVTLANPMSDERKYYRISVLPSLLETFAYNNNHSQTNFGLFELSDVYNDQEELETRLALGLTESTIYSDWQKMERKNDFYTLKGMIVSLLEKLGINANRLTFVPNKTSVELFHPTKSAEILLDNNLIGIIGNIHPEMKKELGVSDIVVGEINLSMVYQAKKAKIKYVPVTKYPTIAYDLAVIVEDRFTAKELTSTIKSAAGRLLVDVNVFDVYQGANIEKGFKSMAFKLKFRDDTKTLKDDEVKPLFENVINKLIAKFNAKVRDN